MKNASAALKAFIPLTRQFFEADLFTVTPGGPQNWLRWSQDFTKSVWTKSNTIVNSTPIVGPDGQTYTTIEINQNVAANGQLSNVGRVFTFSIWLKAGTLTGNIHLFIENDAGNTLFGSLTVTPTSTWTRYSLTAVLAAGTTGILAAIDPINDTGTGTYYIWGAQIEQRGSAGPYIATQGTGRYGNAGPVPEIIRLTSTDRDIAWQGNTYFSGAAQNLLSWSQGFNNSIWLYSQLTQPSSPTIVAPDGTTTAYALIPTGGATNSFVRQQIPMTAGVNYTFSVWLKVPSGSKTIGLLINDSAGLGPGTQVNVNLTAAWQRFSVTRTAQIPLSDSGPIIGGNSSWTAGEVDVWGAQFEIANTLSSYLPTYAIPWSNGKISRSNLKWAVGLTVDTLNLMIDAPNLAPLIVNGFFDGARVQLDRLYGTSFGQWIDSVTLFAGNVADIKTLGRTRCEFEVRSRVELMNNSLPRQIYQPSCRWSLFDPGCTLNKLSFGVVGIVQSGSTQFQLAGAAGLGFTDGYFDLGTIVFVTGPNAGFAVTVKNYSHTNGTVTFFALLPKPPNTGDTFIIYPGCDKRQTTCSGKFNNLINFGGMPYVPVPEMAI
jgi:uncharacterized phage protein (TIGR02218 family)